MTRLTLLIAVFACLAPPASLCPGGSVVLVATSRSPLTPMSLDEAKPGNGLKIIGKL